MTISTKKVALLVLLFVSTQFAIAQVKVGDNPTTINKGSILELESPDKGLLFPRIGLTNTTTWSLATGSLPVAGMVVYNTKKVADGFAGTIAYPSILPDGTGLYYWDGAGWVATKGAAAALSNDWTILGNTGTSATTNFLGTTDAVDLVFRTTNTQRMKVLAGGNIEIPNSTATTAIIYKDLRPFIHNNGSESTAVGVGALNLGITTARRNDAFGYEALAVVTSGNENTALGRFALHNLLTGSDNMAVGGRTLENLQTGNGNVAVGRSVMPGLETGSNNISIGSSSNLRIKPGASSNTSIGAQAGGNTAVGFGIGNSNVLIGFQAGYSHTGDNRLMIDVSATNTPLIDGDFATRVLTVNNTLKVADLATGATATTGNRPVVADADGQLRIGSGVAETLTTLTKGTGVNSGKFTYLNEAGTPVDIKVTQSGAGVPAAGTGSAGDVYINTTNGDVYTYNTTDNAWKKAGETLTTLTKGTGVNSGKFTYLNEAGTPVEIKVTQSGAGAPAAGTGLAGDVYVDTATGDVYTYNGVTNAWQKPTPVIADVRRIGTNHLSEDAGVGSNGTSIPGNFNIAIGPGAMSDASTANAYANVAIGGGNQLAKITTPGNVAIGYANLPKAVSGNNIAIGGQNLDEAVNADANTVVGVRNLRALISGGSNAAIGNNNLNTLTTGGSNHVFGFNSLQKIQTSSQNIAIGSDVLQLAEGEKNIGVGSSTLHSLGVTGKDNVALGVNAGGNLTTGSYNTFFGTEAGNRLLDAPTQYTGGDNGLFLGSQTKAKPAVSNQLNIGNWIYGENGAIAMGNFSATALPTITATNRLDIVTGNIRVRDLYTTPAVVADDKIVVTGPTGVLKTMSASALGAVNIYNSDGTLTGNRTVTTVDNPLNFVGTGSSVNIVTNATEGRLTATGTDRGSLTVTGGNSILDIYTDNNQKGQIASRGAGSTGLILATEGATPLSFQTTNTERMRITSTGEVAIGATTAPSFLVGATTIQPKLHVDGDISTTGKLWTTNSVYADYVFEDYFNGFSKIYKDYKFKTLKEVAEFIKANKHLPGVTPISEVNRGKNGYTIDLTQLSMQQLEKLEELYLHVIEMNDKMSQKDNEIKALQNKTDELEERLKKLETLLIKK